MSALKQVMQVIGSHHISNELLESDCDKSGGLISNGEYAWFAAGANLILYSKQLGSVLSSRSFATNQKDKSLTITFVQELHKRENSHFLLVGCSCKSFGLLFICQLPTLTTIRCIHIPNPISYISTINNESLAQDQLCDEFKVMSTVLLVGMITGAVFAVDLRHRYIENQLRRNEIVVNESRPSKLFTMRKNEDCQEVKEMGDDGDCHLAMFINENFCIYCKKQYRGKLNFSISSLLYNEEINTVAIGYSTGHFQLWDCKVMRTIYLLKDPKCVMPVTHITFLEPSDDPNNLCYLWVIQSDNSRLPNAMMIALTYEQRTMMSNGCLSYRVYKGNGIKLEMSLRRESGIGRCISALTLCNVNLFRNETDMDEDCEIRLFAMLMEVRQNVDANPESYVFLFDINQWYKAQMPSNINHLKVSNSYASFVKLPHNVSYLDLNISDKTLRPFGYNFRNNVEELYYPSSIYFECDCLLDTEIIRFKHAGVQQEILDQLLLKNWRLLINPSLIFSQCLQTNLRPFFWDKTDDYVNYSLPDQRSFVISIIVENKIMSVLSACAEEWKNGTYVSSEATILHLVQCLWKHVMVVKQYADKLCVPLFDYSGTQLGKKDERILNHCLSQMLCVKHFLEDLHNAYGIHIINVDYSYRVYTLNLVTQYFKAVTCFLNYGLLPESNEEDPTQKIIKCDFSSLIEYAIKRRMEFGDLSLYLIDAFVSNEPKGNKLIEQWQHEGGEATKGLYPPSNVQCLLRIYLNAALSNQVKDFITIYFLIDVCSSHEIDVITANRMCNFAVEFDVENKGLNTLCRASWLLDHDMFEEAMDILASSHEWLVNDKSWDWYHWTVLKLLVYKEQYFWARFYMQLTKISLVNIDDHKFYVNLQIMNNQCFDTLVYLRARPFKEKQTLFEYFFDRCRETNKLKCLIDYLWDVDETELFFSYLKKFDDTETLTFQLLFLLQRGRHKEAIKLNQTLKASLKSNNNDALTITSLLVDGFEKNIPNIMKNDYGRLPLQSVYKKPNVVVKCMNNESKMFVMDRNKVNNLVKRRSASFTPSNSIDLFLPANNSTRKRSPIDDMICNEKRRKIDENLLSTPNANKQIVKPIEKQVLEILNTPLVEKTTASPSITSFSSILKTKFATNKQKILFSLDKTPRSSIRFSLPANADTTVERVDFEEVLNVQQIDNPENESFYSVNSSDANDLPIQIISEQIPLTFHESLKENSKMDMSDEYEKMDISEENPYSGHEQIKIDDMSENETKNEEMVLSSADECVVLTSEEEDDKEISVSKLSPKNTSLALNEDIKLLTSKSVSIDKKEILDQYYTALTPLVVDNNCLIPNIQDNLSKNEKPLFKDISTACLIQNTNSNERLPVKKINDDIDCILLDSDEDESDILSVGSSRKNLSDDSIVSGGSIITEGDIGSDGSIIVSGGTNESDDTNESDGTHESDGSIVLDDSITSDGGNIASDDGSIASEDSELDNTRYGRFKSQRRRDGEDSNDEELEEEYIEEEEDDDEIEEEEIEEKCEEDEIAKKSEEVEIAEGEEDEIAEEGEEDEIAEEGEDDEIAEEGEEDEIAEEGEEDEIAEEGEEEEEITEEGEEDPEEGEEDEITEEGEEDEIAEEGEEEEEETAKEGEVDEIVEEGKEFEIYCLDSEESDGEVSPKQCENKRPRVVESDSEHNSEVNNETEHPSMDDLDQQNIKFDENEDIGSENKDKRYDNDNDENKSEDVVFIDEDEDEDQEDQEDFEFVENEEPDEVSDENNSEELVLDSGPDVPIFTEEELRIRAQNIRDYGLQEPVGIIVGRNFINSVFPNGIRPSQIRRQLNENVENVENVEVPIVIIDDDSNENNSSEEPDVLDLVSEENSSEEPDVLDLVSEENSSEEPDVLDDESEENSSEGPDVSLNVGSEENNSEVLACEQNNFEESNVILNDESIANNLKLFEALKNEKTLEKNELVDSHKIVYPNDSQSNSLENLTPRMYNVAEETHSNDNSQICFEENENSRSIKIEDDKTNDSRVIEDNENVIEVVENTDKVNEPINLDDIENNKDNLSIDQNEDNHCDEYTSNNDHSFEMFRNESNPIPDDGFNHLTMPGVEANQLEVDVNQSTPFMFGESFFGRQEIPEKKPMLLFGHLYSLENEQLNVDVQADKLETQESDIVNNGVDITNKEPEVEIEGEIQDILELESLPESNPDDNFDTQNDTDSNNLQPECKKFNETLYDNGQTVLLGDSPHLKPIYFGNIDSVQIFENDDQTPSTSIDLSKKSVELENKDLTSNECCDILTIKKANPSLPNVSEEQIYKTDTVPTNTVENYTTNSVNTMESDKSTCVVEDDEKVCPISQRSITTTTEPNKTVGPHCPDASGNIQNENKINLVENLAELDKCCQKSSLNIPRIENYSLRSSSRRSISKPKECLLDIPSTTVQILTRNKTKMLSDPIQENKTNVIDQIKKAKSIPPVDTTPITTRSRAKSEPKQVQLEPISSNIFRSSGMVEENSRQVRVSLSKKRTKSQENISSMKRRSGRSKSLAPEKSEANKRKTVFGLEEIPEEDTPNTDTNIIKTEHTALKKKPKFNFLSNSSKKIEYVNLNPKCQEDTKIRTPRRSKSLQPDPVLTFSVVKTKPKRSSSVNMLISNDEIPTEKDDLMGVLKKALNPPEKIRKRSVTESLRSRKKQKIQNQVEEEKKEVAESKYNLNESNQSNQFSNSSYSSEQLSPIVGNISQHMLYTPAKKQTKIRMMNLDTENEDSSSDESTDSNRIMTRSMIQNSSIVELDPIRRTLKSEIRPSKVPINRQRRRSSSVSNIPESKTPKKSASSVFEKDELLFSKRKAKHIKETIVRAPIEPSIEQPSTSERRITRFQQSILDKSLQSTSVIGQDTTTNNITVPKPEKKKITKKN